MDAAEVDEELVGVAVKEAFGGGVELAAFAFGFDFGPVQLSKEVSEAGATPSKEEAGPLLDGAAVEAKDAGGGTWEYLPWYAM